MTTLHIIVEITERCPPAAPNGGWTAANVTGTTSSTTGAEPITAPAKTLYGNIPAGLSGKRYMGEQDVNLQIDILLGVLYSTRKSTDLR